MNAPCPSCGEVTLVDAPFCEACGADLPTGPPCVSCGADAVDGQYCLQCGHRQPGSRDHLEAVDGRVAGVTDKGHRHHQNEDAMAFADTELGRVLVVCDGVSTTDRSEEASQAAADTAAAVLVSALGGFDATAAFAAATHAAQDAVLAVPVDPAGMGNPSCTFVAAVVENPAEDGTVPVHVGWLGDSRAYRVGPDPECLTWDHSWAAEVVAAGLLEPAVALADPRANSITRFLGADAVDVTPSIESRRMGPADTVVVCSDGLWNYAPEPAELAARPEWQRTSDLDRARALTTFALEAGGHDNVTVVLTAVAAAAEGVHRTDWDGTTHG